ncbi:MAG: penicillin acylase family protein [Mucilaginibacter sp.]|nr:penicillin acylase family protein [Mucilaginibacter sp.]
MPKRDPKLNWTLPVDGTTSATEWQGTHPLNEIVHVYDPATGWIENCNSTPYTCSGTSSPDKNKYPAYMATNGQNYRGINALRLFNNAKNVSLDELIAKGYDHYLAMFDDVLPPLFRAYESANDSIKKALAGPIGIMKNWDRHSAANSVATSIAVEWGTRLIDELPHAQTVEESTYQTVRFAQLLKKTSPKRYLGIFSESLQSLEKRYGTWKMEWGEINRYQRPADGITFDDKSPSLPVALVGSQFGQLASYQSKSINTQKRYGYSGNSFIAAVEFGPRLKAKSIITGGESFDPASTHFTDQAEGFINGHFKDILFYKADVLKHAIKTYHPGD